MANLWFGAAWIAMGLIWLRRAYTGQRAAVALVTLMGRPENVRITRRECRFALLIGILNLALGVVNMWLGLRHR